MHIGGRIKLIHYGGLIKCELSLESASDIHSDIIFEAKPIQSCHEPKLWNSMSTLHLERKQCTLGMLAWNLRSLQHVWLKHSSNFRFVDESWNRSPQHIFLVSAKHKFCCKCHLTVKNVTGCEQSCAIFCNEQRFLMSTKKWITIPWQPLKNGSTQKDCKVVQDFITIQEGYEILIALQVSEDSRTLMEGNWSEISEKTNHPPTQGL